MYIGTANAAASDPLAFIVVVFFFGGMILSARGAAAMAARKLRSPGVWMLASFFVPPCLWLLFALGESAWPNEAALDRQARVADDDAFAPEGLGLGAAAAVTLILLILLA